MANKLIINEETAEILRRLEKHPAIQALAAAVEEKRREKKERSQTEGNHGMCREDTVQ